MVPNVIPREWPLSFSGVEGKDLKQKEAQVLKGEDIRQIVCTKLDGVYMCFICLCCEEKPKRLVLGSDEYWRGFQ